VPWLDEWEKGWNEKLKAETLKAEMPMPGNIVPMVILAAGGEWKIRTERFRVEPQLASGGRVPQAKT